MIRSSRIPSVLRRICTDDVIQTALLVTTDGELLGSTATTFVGPDGTTTESIESLGTLIADIAVDYGKLGEEYASLDPPSSSTTTTTTTTSVTSNSTSNATTTTTVTVTGSPRQHQRQHQQQQQQQQQQPRKSSHLRCLLLELELGLVAVAACESVDCMVIALAAPNAPLGTVRARLQAIAAHVQEALGPLAGGGGELAAHDVDHHHHHAAGGYR